MLQVFLICILIGICLYYTLHYYIALKKCMTRDHLTHMPNDIVLEKLFNHYAKKQMKLAIIVFSINELTTINNAIGHLNGDLIIRYVGEKLRRLEHRGIKSFRVWGDRFAIMMLLDQGEEMITEWVEKLFEELDEEIELDAYKYNLSASVGIALYPKDGEKIEDLLGKAEISMYYAKEVGVKGYRFFENEMKEQVEDRLTIGLDLKDALTKDELYLCYQPQVHLPSFKVVGFEALIRWLQPEKGNIPPDVFIKVAEETGLIIEIGKWVLEESLKFIKDYHRIHQEEKYVAINVSVIQLVQAHFVEDLFESLERYEVKKEWIELEVTETVLVKTPAYLINVLAQLREQGIRIAIDDFGKGYSNLNYLQQLPLDVLKIDKAFIDGIQHIRTAHVILSTIVQMARQLNVDTLAEGVETIEQLQYLREIGYQKAQGYLFSKAVKKEALEETIQEIEKRNWLEELKNIE